ncbi:MAG TPA: hypothetical protein VN397_04195, partial [Candidatus Methylomirabilis sp.]|nr:hypothetical protein [Candidatus Methylomirabilis sp.]
PMDLPACIESLKDSKEDAEKALRIAYYALLAGASDRQRGAIRDLGERKVWTPSEAVVYLQQANGNLDVFIRLLESRVKLPGKSPLEQGADWVKKNWKALLGMKPADAPSQAQPAPAAGAAAQPPVPADNAATEVDAVRGAVNGFSRNIRRDAARRTRRADRLEAEFNRKR